MASLLNIVSVGQLIEVAKGTKKDLKKYIKLENQKNEIYNCL